MGFKQFHYILTIGQLFNSSYSDSSQSSSLQFPHQPQHLLVLVWPGNHLHSQWEPLCTLAIGVDHLVGQVVRGVAGHGRCVLLRPLGDGNDSSGEVHSVPGHIGKNCREESAKDSTRRSWQQHGRTEESVHASRGEFSQVILKTFQCRN